MSVISTSLIPLNEIFKTKKFKIFEIDLPIHFKIIDIVKYSDNKEPFARILYGFPKTHKSIVKPNKILAVPIVDIDIEDKILKRTTYINTLTFFSLKHKYFYISFFHIW